MKSFVRVLSASLALAFAPVCLAGDIESGPKVGESAAPFVVHDVTGPSKGKDLCYRCKYGNNPVVAIFTREMTDPLIDAIKDLDTQVGKDENAKAFVVMLTDDKEKAAKQLAMIAEEKKITHVPLTLVSAKGPEDYMINEKAGVTVLMWKEGEVMVNHAFGMKEFCPACHKMVMADVAKLTK